MYSSGVCRVKLRTRFAAGVIVFAAEGTASSSQGRWGVATVDISTVRWLIWSEIQIMKAFLECLALSAVTLDLAKLRPDSLRRAPGSSRSMAQSLWARLREFDPDPTVLASADAVKQVRSQPPSRRFSAVRPFAYFLRGHPFSLMSDLALDAPHNAPHAQWIVIATVFKRAQVEIDAKKKILEHSLTVGDDGTVCGRCAGSSAEVYDVKFRIRGPNNEALVTDEIEPPVVDVACTCPAAKGATGSAGGNRSFCARATAENKKTQPRGACKHVVGLLLWRARILAAASDPDPSEGGGGAVQGAKQTNGNVGGGEGAIVSGSSGGGVTAGNSNTAGTSAAAGTSTTASTPSPPVAAPYNNPGTGGKKRRVPGSLVQSAAAAAEAVKRRKTTVVTVAKTVTAKTVTAKQPTAPKPKKPPVAALKREPGLPPAAPAGPVISRADREIIGKVHTIDDAALVAAAERAMGVSNGGDGAAPAAPARAPVRASTRTETSTCPAATGAGPSSAGGAVPEIRNNVVTPGRSDTTTAKQSVPANKPAPPVDDLFASFLPAEFKMPAPAAGSNTPATAPIAAPAAVPAPVVHSAPPAVATVSTPVADPLDVFPAPVAAETPNEGPKKMSFAELMASGGF
tara:strand:+ start:37540 stop:39420 length:1881 start_codon:yes stop_codon:yes gene_type:complete